MSKKITADTFNFKSFCADGAKTYDEVAEASGLTGGPLAVALIQAHKDRAFGVTSEGSFGPRQSGRGRPMDPVKKQAIADAKAPMLAGLTAFVNAANKPAKYTDVENREESGGIKRDIGSRALDELRKEGAVVTVRLGKSNFSLRWLPAGHALVSNFEIVVPGAKKEKAETKEEATTEPTTEG
jgi:hypothetical protein